MAKPPRPIDKMQSAFIQGGMEGLQRFVEEELPPDYAIPAEDFREIVSGAAAFDQSARLLDDFLNKRRKNVV